MNKTVNEIARLVNGAVVGDGEIRVTGVNGIREAQAGDLTFLGHARYLPYLETTRASAILVPQGCTNHGRVLIQVENPYAAFAQVLEDYENEIVCRPTGIHPTAVLGHNVRLGRNVALDAHVCIASDCEIGDDVILYAGVYVGAGCRIGPGTIVYPNTVIRDRSQIGARCLIHCNVSIGSDGFGFVLLDGVQRKIPQVGVVIIEDDVEIGANSAIDRGTLGATFIGQGTKIDNLVQIGHNVRIGRHCVVSGCTGVAGSAVIGDYVTVGGNTGINGHIEIGDHAVIAGQSGVTKSVKARSVVSGFPATDHNVSRRYLAAKHRLPELIRRVRQLERDLDALRAGLNGQATDDH